MGHMLRFIIVLSCLALFLGCAQEPAQEPKDTTPPTTPSNLIKTSPDNDNTPTFTWEAASDEDSGVDYYLVSMDHEKVLRNVGNVTTYTWSNALSEGSHTFEVKAVDKAGNEGAAASLTFTVETSPPKADDT